MSQVESEMELPNKAKLLQFETNTICKGKCTFCTHGKMKKRKPMPLHRIVDLLYHLGHKANEIFPFYMQEPLLEPRLLKILSNVKLFNPRGHQSLYTTFPCYPKALLKKILQWGLVDSWMVSFYGGDKETHDRMQPGIPYAQTKRFIKNFVKLRDSLGWQRPRISLAYLVTPESLPNLKKVLKEWTPILPVMVFRWDSWCGELPYNQEFQNRFWGEPGTRELCKQLWKGIYINADGDLLPCCMDYNAKMKVGNVFKDGYDLWWTSSELNTLRKLHQEKRWDEVDLCKSCTKWRYAEHIGKWVETWQQKTELAESMTTYGLYTKA